MPKDNYIVNRLKSMGFAFKGMLLLIKKEANVRLQLLIAIIVTVAGIYFKLSATEWLIQILVIGLILGLEGLNTAIEQLCDFVHPEQHEKIGRIKDIAAGAVFIAAITAVIIGLIIYFPKIF
jgi:diacylglycerol kinase (ATP)